MLLENIEKLNEDIEVAKAQLQNDQTIREIQKTAIIELERKLTLMEQNLANGENKNLSINQSDVISHGSVKFHLGDNLQLEDKILSTTVVKLSTTCAMLSDQVQQLQDSVRQLVHGLSFFCNQSQKRIEEILLKTCTTPRRIKIARSTQTPEISRSLPVLKSALMETNSKQPMSKNISTDQRKILLAKKKSLSSKLHLSKSLHSSKA